MKFTTMKTLNRYQRFTGQLSIWNPAFLLSLKKKNLCLRKSQSQFSFYLRNLQSILKVFIDVLSILLPVKKSCDRTWAYYMFQDVDLMLSWLQERRVTERKEYDLGGELSWVDKGSGPQKLTGKTLRTTVDSQLIRCVSWMLSCSE